MAAINLLNIQPHQVSRDLSGYITFIYGAPKTGKTTLATQMKGSLLLAFERGYNALPGVIAQDITSWSEFRQVYRELKKPEVKANFNAVILDTIDIAADMCQKYICNQKDIESLGDLGYGKGWTAFKEEFNEVIRGLTQLGYAVFFIGHHKEVTVTDPDGTERIVIRPSLSNSTRTVVEGMADIYGYAHQSRASEMSVLTLRSPDDSISCGGRFKYLPNEIPLSYSNLVSALSEAIEKEAAENGGQFVTNEKLKVTTLEKEYDYDEMMKQVNELINKLMTLNQSNAVKITSVIEKYLGKGRKVADCTPTQCEQLELIILDLNDLLG
jgi:hypothetical protein